MDTLSLDRALQMKTERVRARKIQNVEVKGNDEVMFVARVAADFECSPKVWFLEDTFRGPKCKQLWRLPCVACLVVTSCWK